MGWKLKYCLKALARKYKSRPLICTRELIEHFLVERIFPSLARKVSCEAVQPWDNVYLLDGRGAKEAQIS